MRVFSSLFSSVLTALLMLDIATAFAPAPPPTFETLFVGTWTVGEVLTIPDGTFGTRLHGAVTGGNLSDPAGNIVGTILPTADTGIVAASGTFFPQAIFPIVWTADNTYAHLELQGVGEFLVEDMLYIHVETDSEQYRALNSRFLIGNLTFQDNIPMLTVFGWK
ncbi:hypothetical protein C8Q76DRAFT_792709 [Earliella scabrosa]|nr:hypothetical protein C8Q76DRAFT_792709 [Earliella scabrosa]